MVPITLLLEVRDALVFLGFWIRWNVPTASCGGWVPVVTPVDSLRVPPQPVITGH